MANSLEVCGIVFLTNRKKAIMKNNKKTTNSSNTGKNAGISGQSNKDVKPKSTQSNSKKGVAGLEQQGSIKNSK